MSIIIRPYRDADWPRLCAIHDAARQTELALAGLPNAFLPLEIAAQREGRVRCLHKRRAGLAVRRSRLGPPGGGPGPGGTRSDRDGAAGFHRGALRQCPRSGSL